MYTQTQLPYSAEQIQRGFLQGLGPANPPFTPQLQGIQPWLANYVPAIAGWVAAEIQNTAESNALRRFFFNMFSQNNFANEDFISLVQAAADYVQLQIMSNPQLRVEQVLTTAIPQTVEMFVSHMARVWPQLNAYLTPHQQYTVTQQHQTFDGIKASITQMKQGGMMQQQPPMLMQQQPMQGGMMMRGDPRLGGGGPASLGMNLTGPAVSLSGPSAAQVTAQGRSMASSDRWAVLPDLSTPRTVGITVNPQEPQANPSNVQIARSSIPLQSNTNQTTEASIMNTPIVQTQEGPLEPIETSTLKWERSVTQPYFPAWDPSKQELFLQRLANGDTVARMKRKDANIMDYERHKLTSVFGPALPQLDLTNTQVTLEVIQKGLVEIAQEKQERLESVEPSFSTRVNPNWYADVTNEMIWLKGACNWMQSTDNGKRPDIYRQYGQVVEMVVGAENEENFIESFRDAGTFANLFKMLNEVYGKCSTTLWYRVNQRITDLVNRVLSFNLSLTGWSIDSFALDGLKIIDVLKEHFGDVVHGAFLKNQAYLIRSIFEAISDEDAIALDGNFIPHPDDKAELDPTVTLPVFTHLVSNASFTFLNCLAHELSLEFKLEHPAILTDSLTPVVYRLVQSIMEDAKSYSGATLGRHFIQTLDGHILEVDTGYIGDETYLLRKLK